EKGADGQNGKDGTNGTNGTDGGTSAGFVWKGELDANPSEPQTNWAYYNKTDKKAYIYDGAKWSILAQDGKDGQNGNDGQPGTNGNDGTIIVWQGSLTAAPASPVKGWCYYNSTDKKSYMYDGTTWQMIAQDGQNGTLIVWKDASETAPENPVTGWCYYNSTDKTSFMYDGTAWQMIAQDGKDYEPPKVFAFTVNAEGKKVVFSSGNLQYTVGTGYHFADNQYDYIGNTSANQNCTGTFDLFCWGTGDVPAQKQVTVSSFTDWGGYIEPDKHWYTLTAAEWTYIKTNSPNAWKEITVGGNTYKGWVILPDGCDKTIATTDWSELETVGAVFLPAAGNRNGTGVCDVGSGGYYWSATPDGGGDARLFYFNSGYSDVLPDLRVNGVSVRLVRSL
ncbi:MAG: hypothetical protein VZQ51_04350, partial [Bacteroidales bacterium]|nr:hypothetical protein [Bacteroidales bacterium]